MKLQTPAYGQSRHIYGIDLQVDQRTSGEVQIEYYRHHSDIRKLAFTHPYILDSCSVTGR
jgi:hypothetical protein